MSRTTVMSLPTGKGVRDRPCQPEKKRKKKPEHAEKTIESFKRHTEREATLLPFGTWVRARINAGNDSMILKKT